MSTYERGNAAYQHHEALRDDFAKQMRHTKICVFDSSTEKKMIRKFAQALLSGCVVVSCLRLSLGWDERAWLIYAFLCVDRRAIFLLSMRTCCPSL